MTALRPEILEQLSGFIDRRLGLHFPESRHRELLRGLARAATELGMSGPEELARLILSGHADQRLLDVLAGNLVIGETYFFRDKRLLELLRQEVLPDLLRKARVQGRGLRIWSAGCCSGEEPYTLAMIVKELSPDGQPPVTILATDLNPRFLDKARRGIYREWSFRETPERARQAWFRPLPDGAWELSPEIRAMVSLASLNLAADPYPAMENRTNGQDLILCRNVLMYFSPRLGLRVVSKLHRCLVEDGLLVVGPSEGALVTRSGLFGVSLGERGILYRRVPCPPDAPAAAGMPAPAPEPWRLSEPPDTRPSSEPEAPGLLDKHAREGAIPMEQALHDARAAFERGCYSEAGARLAAVDRARLSKPQRGLLAHLTARLLAGSGDLGNAEKACREAVAEDKMHAGHHYLLAVILQEMRRLEEAVEAFRKALYLDQDFILAHFSLGMLLGELGREEESRRGFENALAGLAKLDRGKVVPESEGLTAGRLTEIIQAMTGC